MKKTLSAFVAILSVLPFIANAQWSGTSPIYYNAGNVGIGTSTPIFKFQVESGVAGVARFATSTTGNTGNISIVNGSNYNYGVIGVVSGTGISTGDVYGLGYCSNANSSFTNILNWTSIGNIGIGTTTPDEKLVVNGTIKTILDGVAFPAKNVARIIPLGYSGLSGAQNWAIRGVYQYNNGVSYNTDGGDLDIIKSMDGNTILATKSDGSPLGNVGIGTADTKGYKLAVNGDAIATSMTVKLYADWADYVFKPAYKLPSLSEVKTYIDQNQHLPEIPSEAEVKKRGVNLGEMNKLLLKKVEELTLYLIEKDKEVKEQQELNKQILQRLELLEKKN